MTDIPSPGVPAYDRRVEVEALLAEDTSVLGHLWAYEQEGLTPQQMAEREGTVTTGWVSIYRMLVRVLRDGEVPTAPSMATTAARRVRKWLKNPNLSPSLRAELQDQEALITSRAEDTSAVAEETETAVETSKRAEAAGRPGVYVWSLPHYLNYPVDQKRGHTLYKVGHSSVDAYNRVRDARWVGLPEDPVLRRIYPVDASAAAEREFHEALRAADHFQQVNVKAGTEWYLTSLRYLDYIARRMRLDVEEYNAQYETGSE
ncbi:GIY-YIG nuclease family protein [Nocardioides bigeumensis]